MHCFLLQVRSDAASVLAPRTRFKPYQFEHGCFCCCRNAGGGDCPRTLPAADGWRAPRPIPSSMPLAPLSALGTQPRKARPRSDLKILTFCPTPKRETFPQALMVPQDMLCYRLVALPLREKLAERIKDLPALLVYESLDITPVMPPERLRWSRRLKRPVMRSPRRVRPSSA